jgi:hypothetical protein
MYQLTRLDDNHQHKPISFLMYTSLPPLKKLAMIQIIYDMDQSVINMTTLFGSGLPLAALLCKLCHHTKYGSTIDFSLKPLQLKYKDMIELGAYLISKGAKIKPHFGTFGEQVLAINSHLWYREIEPLTTEILLLCYPLPLVSMILNYTIDLHVYLCFLPDLKGNWEIKTQSKQIQNYDKEKNRQKIDLLTLMWDTYVMSLPKNVRV